MLVAIWDEDNEAHIHEHGLTCADVDSVLANPTDYSTSQSSGRPVAFGFTVDGRFVLVVYEPLDEVFVYPITAYEVDE